MHHVRAKHTDFRFACEKCGKSYTQSSALYRHIKAKHLEHPFKCSFCDKTFPFKKTFEDHQMSHDKNKDNTKINKNKEKNSDDEEISKKKEKKI